LIGKVLTVVEVERFDVPLPSYSHCSEEKGKEQRRRGEPRAAPSWGINLIG
jgi:hypothetical protein